MTKSKIEEAEEVVDNYDYAYKNHGPQSVSWGAVSDDGNNLTTTYTEWRVGKEVSYLYRVDYWHVGYWATTVDDNGKIKSYKTKDGFSWG